MSLHHDKIVIFVIIIDSTIYNNIFYGEILVFVINIQKMINLLSLLVKKGRMGSTSDRKVQSV